MSVTVEQLYDLLPAIYRQRDQEQNGPLRALLAVLAEQADRVEQDMDQLYANWFIETCAEWVVPYIGDLLGVRGLNPSGNYGISQRALVANTLRYRRQKGTLAVLEALAQDITGWPARAVELYTQLGVTQNLNHLRPALGGTTDLRRFTDATLGGSPFDPARYTPDLRHPDQGRSRPNLPNLGIFLWRLQPYWLEQVAARALGNGRYTFSPLGHTTPLFNAPNRFLGVAGSKPATGEIALPGGLRRHAVREDKAWLTPPVAFAIMLGGQPLTAAEIGICDLSGWKPPNGLQAPRRVAVDPELGRFVLLDTAAPPAPDAPVLVSYAYGFSSDLGGGPYDRRATALRPSSATADGLDTVADPYAHGILIEVGTDDSTAALPLPARAPTQRVATLAEALTAWEKLPRKPAIIQIADNRTYPLTAAGVSPAPLRIELHGRKLVIQAKNMRRPVLLGNLEIVGGGQNSELTLSGLLIDGTLAVRGTLGRLTLSHCTLAPDCSLTTSAPENEVLGAGGEAGPEPLAACPSLQVASASAPSVLIDHCITGPLRLPAKLAALHIRDSVIDATQPARHDPRPRSHLPAIAAARGAGPPAQLERSTILGAVQLTQLPLAVHVLFTEPVQVAETNRGCVHYCYLPVGSQTPRPYRCQPDPDLKRTMAAHLHPAFTAQRYGQPGYAQLSSACPAEIRRGGEDETEIGAFHELMQPQREANLRTHMQEYLRSDLVVGILFADETPFPLFQQEVRPL